MKGIKWIILAVLCVVGARGVQIIAYPEWTEAQALREMWMAYSVAAVSLVLAALENRAQ